MAPVAWHDGLHLPGNGFAFGRLARDQGATLHFVVVVMDLFQQVFLAVVHSHMILFIDARIVFKSVLLQNLSSVEFPHRTLSESRTRHSRHFV